MPSGHESADAVRRIIVEEFTAAGLDANFALQVALRESGYNTHIIGDAGKSHGIFQLHEEGLLPGFYAAGFNDWTDPRQQAKYVAGYVRAHQGEGYYGWQPWTAARDIIEEGSAVPVTNPDDYPAWPGSSSTGTNMQQEVALALVQDFISDANARGDHERARELTVLQAQLQAGMQITLRQVIGDQEMEQLLKRYELDQALYRAKLADDKEYQGWLIDKQREIDEAAEGRTALRNVWQLLTQNQWAVEEQKREFEFRAGEAAKQREHEASQAAQEREARSKESALGEVGATTRQFMQNAAQARQQLGETLGRDVLRGAAQAGGQLVRGTTPMQAFRNKLQGIATARMPYINPNQTAAGISGALRGVARMAAGAPSAPATLGMAGGGVLEMARGKGDSYELRPDNPSPDIGGETGVGVLVGEGPNHVELPPGTEVMEVRSDGVRIIPLVARAAGGLVAEMGKDARLGTKGLGAPARRARTRRAQRPRQKPAIASAATVTRLAPPASSAPQPEGGLRAPGVTPARLAGTTPEDILRLQGGKVEPGRQPAGPAGVSAALMTAAQGAQGTAAGTRVEETPAYLIQGIVDRWMNGTQPTIADADLLQRLAGEYPSNGSLEYASLAIRQYLQRGEASGVGIVPLRNAIMAALTWAQGLPGGPPPPDEEPPGEPPPDETRYELPPLILPQGLDAAWASEFVSGLLARFPQWTQADLDAANQAGFLALADIINAVLRREVDPNAAYGAVASFVPMIDELQQPADEGEYDYDLATIRQALEYVWRHIGVNPEFMLTGLGPFGGTQLQNTENPLAAARGLGVRLQLVRDATTGQVFYIDELGAVHAITDPAGGVFGGQDRVDAQLAELRIDPRDIVTLPTAEIMSLGNVGGGGMAPDAQLVEQGTALIQQALEFVTTNNFDKAISYRLVQNARALGLGNVARALELWLGGRASGWDVKGMLTEEAGRLAQAGNQMAYQPLAPGMTNTLIEGRPEAGAFPAPANLITMPLSSAGGAEGQGYLLPAPEMIASLMADLRVTNPTLAGAIDYAYELASYDGATARMNWFTPFGTFDPRQIARFG